MKKAYSALAILVVLLGFCLWNAKTVDADAHRWQNNLRQADALIRAERWPEAQEILKTSYQDWTAQQPHLRIVSTHNILDEAECTFCRVLTFASIEDHEELLSELSELGKQLDLLSMREQLSIENIL